jgi:hypothetical protein
VHGLTRRHEPYGVRVGGTRLNKGCWGFTSSKSLKSISPPSAGGGGAGAAAAGLLPCGLNAACARARSAPCSTAAASTRGSTAALTPNGLRTGAAACRQRQSSLRQRQRRVSERSCREAQLVVFQSRPVVSGIPSWACWHARRPEHSPGEGVE